MNLKEYDKQACVKCSRISFKISDEELGHYGRQYIALKELPGATRLRSFENWLETQLTLRDHQLIAARREAAKEE